MKREDNVKYAAKKKLYRVHTEKEACSNSVEESDKNVQLI
jgi:hypothetical protein